MHKTDYENDQSEVSSLLHELCINDLVWHGNERLTVKLSDRPVLNKTILSNNSF